MYTNGKVTDQTCRDEEDQSELCCFLDPSPITNIITSRRQKGETGVSEEIRNLCQILPASQQNKLSLHTGL